MRYAGGPKYEKRIYLDAETDMRLRMMAQQLGFCVERGPTTGDGSPQALLQALCALDADHLLPILQGLLRTEIDESP